MTQPEPTRAKQEQLAEEHESIRGLLAKLRSELTRTQESAGGSADSSTLIELMAPFETQLREHFAFEERDEFLGLPAELNEGMQRKVERLIAEHRELELQVGAIRQRLGNERPRVGAALVAELDAMLAQLSEHEEVECALMQEMISLDLGAGD